MVALERGFTLSPKQTTMRPTAFTWPMLATAVRKGVVIASITPMTAFTTSSSCAFIGLSSILVTNEAYMVAASFWPEGRPTILPMFHHTAKRLRLDASEARPTSCFVVTNLLPLAACPFSEYVVVTNEGRSILLGPATYLLRPTIAAIGTFTAKCRRLDTAFPCNVGRRTLSRMCLVASVSMCIDA